MASNEAPTASTTSQQPGSTTNPSMLAVQHIQQRDDAVPSSTPVEMSQLDCPRSPEMERWTTPPTSTAGGSDYLEANTDRENSDSTAGQQERTPAVPTPAPAAPGTQQPINPAGDGTSSAPVAITTATTTTQPLNPPTDKPATEDTSAIGPSAEDPATVITSNSGEDTTSSEPNVPITLLLTTGARHPFRIDRGYLEKRNVTTRGDDPFTISVYTVKELILRDWRDEWGIPPTTPTSIRLIHFGKLLDDKQTLRDCRFATDSPNVVHMTVKPADLQDDEDNAKGKMGGRGDTDDEGRRVGCRCCLVM